MARSDSGIQSQMEAIERNTIPTYTTQTTSQREPYSNVFQRSIVIASQGGNAAVGTFKNDSSHVKIPFHAENRERTLTPEQ